MQDSLETWLHTMETSIADNRTAAQRRVTLPLGDDIIMPSLNLWSGELLKVPVWSLGWEVNPCTHFALLIGNGGGCGAQGLFEPELVAQSFPVQHAASWVESSASQAKRNLSPAFTPLQ